MFVELHLLQNFPPSCLNRDDTNAPKDCQFGGHRRARISSQCLKRSIRSRFDQAGYLAPEQLGTRSRILIEQGLVPRLVEQGWDADRSRKLAEAALTAMGFGVDEAQSQYLLFLGHDEIDRLAAAIGEHADALSQAADAGGKTSDEGKRTKKQSKAGVPKDVHLALVDVLDGGKAADLALFGRMLADLPDRNIDAACQVAHGISTNAIEMEMDFYTAVDDLQARDEPGAGMMGTIEFNSACFYRYANISVRQLLANLGHDTELTRAAIEAFLRAAITAIPAGKQTTMAAQNPPSLMLAIVREHGLWSLANAFAQPIRPDHPGEHNGQSLVQKSAQRLDDYWGRMTRVYGSDGIVAHPLCLVEDAELTYLSDEQVQSVDELVQRVMQSVKLSEPLEAV